ncbi:MAG: hypothetical protein ACPGQL_04010 [Thermoplasmatota archaeon]
MNLRTPAWSTVLLLLAAGGQASLIEDAASGPCEATLPSPMDDEFCHYQYDGGSYGDARDNCGPTTKRMSPGGGAYPGTITGLMVPFDDEADYYEIVVPTAGSVEIRITPQDPVHADELQLTLGTCSATFATGVRLGDASVVLAAHNLSAGTYYAAARLVTPADDALGNYQTDDAVLDLVSDLLVDEGEWEGVAPPATVVGVLAVIAALEPLEGSAPLVESLLNVLALEVAQREQARSDPSITSPIEPIHVIDMETQCHPYCLAQNTGRATERGAVGYKQTAVFF